MRGEYEADKHKGQSHKTKQSSERNEAQVICSGIFVALQRRMTYLRNFGEFKKCLKIGISNEFWDTFAERRLILQGNACI